MANLNNSNDNWIPWSDKNEQCAPVLGLHKYEPFPPTQVEAFLDENCEFMVQIDISPEGPVYGRINRFSNLTLQQKIQAMLTRKLNRKSSYLDRYGKKIDMHKSAELQKKAPVQVYCRGFRNETTSEAYITYWFFYLENFVPCSKNDEEVKDRLDSHPEAM